MKKLSLNSLTKTGSKQESINLEYEFFLNFESNHTRKAYKSDIKKFLEFLYDNFSLNSVKECSKLHLVAYKTWLSENDYTPKSINRKISSLSTYFIFLIEKNIVKDNPTNGLKKPKQTTVTETNDLSDEEVIKLFEIINHKASLMHKAILLLFFTSGIRKSELINLKHKDFKKNGDIYTIDITAKGGNKLTKYIPMQTAQSIIDYIEHLKQSELDISQEDWIFIPSKNPTAKNANLIKPLDPKSIDYIFKKYTLLANITKRVSPHSARATYIGSALDGGINIVKLAQDVGHKSIKTTQDYYKRRNRIEDSPVNSLGFLKEKK